MSNLPAYIVERREKWDALKAKRDAEEVKEQKDITVTLKDGKTFPATSFVTTPIDICKKLSNSLAKEAIVARIDGAFWDLNRPLEKDCSLEIFTFNSPEGSHCFWHSSAHILGQAIELEFPDAKLCIGPPLEDGGFYYDVFLSSGATVSPADYDRIQKRVDAVIKEKQNFTRLVLSKEEALDLFEGNQFKAEIITKRIPDGELTTAYRCGNLIDLCRGPHVLNTGKVTAMMITRNSSAYWNADATKEPLQRVYGTSFPSKALLEEHKVLLKAAEERDHRRIGTAQQLFFFHPLSPGSCFFLPHGTRLYNRLVDYIRGQYQKRGYNEVVTPNVYNVDLWKQSGHYQNYHENMFTFQVEGQEFAMKPMNCPGHCVLFAHKLHSYRELPMRIADFGVLHRNELSGALTGLTRVRRFQQDDAHIFCTQEQIQAEVAGVLDMLQEVYGHFGFTFSLCLSTRPEKYLGDKALWDVAEAALARCLDEFCGKFGHSWTLNAGDGAFYGPKIDIQLSDALKRKYQCGTCQLDFQLPIRFGLSYRSQGLVDQDEAQAAAAEQAKPEAPKKALKMDKEAKAARAAAYKAAYAARKAAEAEAAAAGVVPEAKVDAKPEPETTEVVTPAAAAAAAKPEAAAPAAAPESCGHNHAHHAEHKEYEWKEQPLPPGHERPVMIHRAILGSVERMIAVLIEHTGGKWPFWLNPRQVIVVPLSESNFAYAHEVRQRVHDAGFYTDIADSSKQFNKKIAEAASEGYGMILVVGAKEAEKGTINVRYNAKRQEEMTINDAIAMFKDMVKNHK